MEASKRESVDPELLVRDAAATEHGSVVDLFASSRSGAAPDVCGPGCHCIVLYDPAGDDIYGAATIRPVAEGTFVLVGVAVRGLPDPESAATRLVREAADQARRAGGERLVADVYLTNAAAGALAAAGFVAVRGAAGEPAAPMMYLEL